MEDQFWSQSRSSVGKASAWHVFRIRFNPICFQFYTESHVIILWLFPKGSPGALISSEYSIRRFFSLSLNHQGFWLMHPRLDSRALSVLRGFGTQSGFFCGRLLSRALPERLSCLPTSSSSFQNMILDDGIRRSSVWLCGYFSSLSLWEFLRKRGWSRFFSPPCVTWVAVLPPTSLTLSPGWWMVLVLGWVWGWGSL